MSAENKEQKPLTDEEILRIVRSAKKPGLRFTVDLYLLDYVKHCFLEDGQLTRNIQKLQTALAHLDHAEAKQGVEDVISSLKCVQQEYDEYLEDLRAMAEGGYPVPGERNGDTKAE